MVSCKFSLKPIHWDRWWATTKTCGEHVWTGLFRCVRRWCLPTIEDHRSRSFSETTRLFHGNSLPVSSNPKSVKSPRMNPHWPSPGVPKTSVVTDPRIQYESYMVWFESPWYHWCGWGCISHGIHHDMWIYLVSWLLVIWLWFESPNWRK